MSTCKVCQSQTEPVMSFGKMPIANGFVSSPSDEEFFFTLAIDFCPACYMVQLRETVPPEMMFNAHYHFISSTSRSMADHFGTMAQEIVNRTQDIASPFIVEIGCNDGIMLQHIARRTIRHVGIEPSSNVARLARDKGVTVSEEFFNAPTAADIMQANGQADIICGANVMCHIENINSVFEGVRLLLKDDGVFFFEDPYLLDIIKQTSFDQIYDEHVYYYCLHSISNLARRHGLQLIDCAPQNVHGGSMRYYLSKDTRKKPTTSVTDFLAQEKEYKLDTIAGYLDFKKKVEQVVSELRATLRDIKQKGERIAAYGATSKSTTLLNYAHIGPDAIEYISDITPTKIGKYSPGVHIPIKEHAHFVQDNPSFTLLLAWNHKKEILKKETPYRQKGGKFITFFPAVMIE